MKSLVLFISGFSQTGKKVSGISKLFKWALKTRRILGADDCRVELYTWRANWEAVAAYCKRDLGVEKVYINAYSWGVGRGAVEVSKYLDKLGITVGWLVSCAGVFRGWGIDSISRINPANWRSLIHRGPLAPKIHLPPSVADVYPLRSRVGKIRGHDFKVVGPTVLHDTVWMTLPHDDMDDSAEFSHLVKKKLMELWWS